MNLLQFKALFILVTAVIALLVASPVLQKVLVYPQTEFFTELSLLGPRHTAQDYPYNISNAADYLVFLEITNHLGSCSYYQVQVKFRNESQSPPNGLARANSDLRSIYNMTVFVANKETFALPVIFSLDYLTTDGNITSFRYLTFNGVKLNINGTNSNWNNGKGGYYMYLFFELWIYNEESESFHYHERYVGLSLHIAPS